MRWLDLRLDAPGREWKEEEKRWLEGGEEIGERVKGVGGVEEGSGNGVVESVVERLRKCKDSGQSVILGVSGGDGGRWGKLGVLESLGDT